MVVDPLDGVDRQSGEPVLVAEGVATAVAGQEVAHLPRPHQQRVARLDGHARSRHGGVEVSRGDGVARFEAVEAVHRRNVEQHGPGDDLGHGLDATRRGARGRGDVGGREAVVHETVVGDVAEGVDVGAGRGAHAHHVVGAEPHAGRRRVALVEAGDGEQGVGAPGRLAHLGPVEVEVHRQREALARTHRGRTSLGRFVGQQIAGAELVVVAPTAPVRDLGPDRFEVLGQRHQTKDSTPRLSLPSCMSSRADCTSSTA